MIQVADQHLQLNYKWKTIQFVKSEYNKLFPFISFTNNSIISFSHLSTYIILCHQLESGRYDIKNTSEEATFVTVKLSAEAHSLTSSPLSLFQIQRY